MEIKMRDHDRFGGIENTTARRDTYFVCEIDIVHCTLC